MILLNEFELDTDLVELWCSARLEDEETSG